MKDSPRFGENFQGFVEFVQKHFVEFFKVLFKDPQKKSQFAICDWELLRICSILKIIQNSFESQKKDAVTALCYMLIKSF